MMQLAPTTPTPTPIPAWAATGRLSDDPRLKSSGFSGLFSSKLPLILVVAVGADAAAVDSGNDSVIVMTSAASFFVEGGGGNDDDNGIVVDDTVEDDVDFEVDVEVVREELRGAGLSVTLNKAEAFSNTPFPARPCIDRSPSKNQK